MAALASAPGAFALPGPTAPPEFAGWARARAIRFDPSPPSQQQRAQSEWLRSMVGPARVVALGEPAHGAHEPLTFRNQLFARLVEELGFTAIALESGLSESQRLYEYVLGAAGDPAELARSGFTWGFGQYAENVQLLRWIRQYNDDAAHSRKVRLYGIDLPGGDEGAFRDARDALDNALAYLARYAPNAHRRVQASLEPFLERFTRAGYLALSSDERERLRAAIGGLIRTFDDERKDLLPASSIDRYEWARRNAVAASQTEELFRLWPPEAPGESVSAAFFDAGVARDASMAANVSWVLDREGPEGRVMVFAHDAHIANAPLRGGIWNVYARPFTVMGQRLRSKLGERELLTLSTTGQANGAGLPARPAGIGGLDLALEGIAKPPFLLDLRGPKPDSVAAWLDRTQAITANFETELELVPSTTMDVIVALGVLSPAQPAR